MREFERTDLREVRKKVDDGAGFVVGDHNYGRVDRMSQTELDAVAKSAGSIAKEAAELLDAIGVVTFDRQIEQSDGENV